MRLKKLFRTFSVMATVLTVTAVSAIAGPVTITFDNLGIPDPYYIAPNQIYDVGGGYQVTGSLRVCSGGCAEILNPDLNGQSYWDGGNQTYQFLQATDLRHAEIVTLSRPDQTPFDLISFDQQGFNNLYAPYVTVTGYLHGGGTVTDTIAVNGALTWPWAHFVTDSLPSTFVDLDSAVFSLVPDPTQGAGVVAYDNIVVSTSDPIGVPEPATLPVFAAILIGLAGLVRYRKSSTRHALS